VQGGIAAMFTGLALMLLVLHLSAPRPGFWALVGPLFLAGLGNGLIIAPNQDFVLGSVPPVQAGTAGGALITAQSATVLNLAFVLAAWLCAFGLPRTLAAERAEENALRIPADAPCAAGLSARPAGS
jgi:hypothetical protein